MPREIACPHCKATLQLGDPSVPAVQCPHCGEQFFAGAPVDESELQHREDAAEKFAARMEDELSALRIKQLSTLRRAAYTTRSYNIIAAAGCAWFTIPLAIATIHFVTIKHAWGLWPTSYCLLIVASVLGAYQFGQQALAVHRQIQADLRARELEEEQAAKNEPDLTVLSDGSQYARSLERLAAGEDEEDPQS